MTARALLMRGTAAALLLLTLAAHAETITGRVVSSQTGTQSPCWMPPRPSTKFASQA
jgi:hypothetical protein